MQVTNLVVAASFLIATFNAIAAIPHIRERHIIRVPLKFKIIHHHKIQKIPIIIRKHVHYHKEKQPVIEETHSNHIFLGDSHDHFGDHFGEDHQEFRNSGISYDHHSDHDPREDDYDEGEQSQEDEYEDDEYE